MQLLCRPISANLRERDFSFVIPAKAGIQGGISEQTAGGLYFGKQTKWYPLYRSDFRPHQEDMEAQKQYGGRFGILHSPVYTFFEKVCIIELNADVETGN